MITFALLVITSLSFVCLASGGRGRDARRSTTPQEDGGGATAVPRGAPPSATADGRTLHRQRNDVAAHLRGSTPLEHLFMAPWLRDDRPTLTPTQKARQPQQRFPLLVFLHGAGEVDTSLDFLSSCDGLTGALPQLALLTDSSLAKQPADDPHRWSVAFPFLRDEFALLAPLSRQSWGSDDDATAALDLISSVLRDFADRIDPTRVVITGVSQGGFGTLRLTQARPEWFAGAAPLCGFGPPDFARTLAVHRVPTLFVHGVNDRMVPVDASDGLVAAFNATIRQRGIPQTVRSLLNTSSSPPLPLLQYWRLEETADPVGYPGTGHASWRNTYADPRFWRWASAVQLQPG